MNIPEFVFTIVAEDPAELGGLDYFFHSPFERTRIRTVITLLSVEGCMPSKFFPKELRLGRLCIHDI